MKSITSDKHINFVLENYSDIRALNELLTHSRAKVPNIVENLVKKCIRELTFELEDIGLEVDSEMDWSHPDMYDDKGNCMFFGVEGDFGYMLSSDEPDADDSPYLYFYIHIERMTKKNSKAFIDKEFEKLSGKVRSGLRKAGITISEKDYETPYLLKYPLYREINFESVMNKELFVKAVQDSVLDFTKRVLKIYLKQ